MNIYLNIHVGKKAGSILVIGEGEPSSLPPPLPPKPTTTTSPTPIHPPSPYINYPQDDDAVLSPAPSPPVPVSQSSPSKADAEELLCLSPTPPPLPPQRLSSVNEESFRTQLAPPQPDKEWFEMQSPSISIHSSYDTVISDSGKLHELN